MNKINIFPWYGFVTSKDWVFKNLFHITKEMGIELSFSYSAEPISFDEEQTHIRLFIAFFGIIQYTISTECTYQYPTKTQKLGILKVLADG